MTILEGADYYTRIVPFPTTKVGGLVMPNSDGTFSIYINSRVDEQRQRKALEHELEHIANGDFWNGKDIREMENL